MVCRGSECLPRIRSIISSDQFSSLSPILDYILDFFPFIGIGYLPACGLWGEDNAFSMTAEFSCRNSMKHSDRQRLLSHCLLFILTSRFHYLYTIHIVCSMYRPTAGCSPVLQCPCASTLHCVLFCLSKDLQGLLFLYLLREATSLDILDWILCKFSTFWMYSYHGLTNPLKVSSFCFTFCFCHLLSIPTTVVLICF